MHDVVVYMSSLPRIADRNRKTQVLRAFAQGTKSLGVKTLLQESRHAVPSRLGVILGWVGTTIAGPHIQLRKDVIARQTEAGNHIMAIDGSCFKFADPTSRWLRYSLGGVFYNQNNYANRNSSELKWQAISRDLDIELRPWQKTGEHILVCLQRDGGWNMKGVNMQQWSLDVVTRLRQLTDRRILVRPHPKTTFDAGPLRQISNVVISDENRTLQQDITNAWCSVFFNSSSSVASILAGVPVISIDSDSVTWQVSSHTLDEINNPVRPDRTQWLWDLAACHWNDQESQHGEIYQHFSGYL